MPKRSRPENGVEKDKAAEKPASFLFAGKADAQVEDIFGKSASYAQPIASTSLLPVTITGSLQSSEPTKTKTKKSKKRKPSPEPSSEIEPVVEANPPSSYTEAVNEAQDQEGSDPEESETLVHESLKSPATKKAKTKSTRTKYVPPNETSSDRDRRTVFLGNLPIETAKSKSSLHQLQSHLLTFAPGAKIESVRFRSVAFATPTSKLPAEDEVPGDVTDGKRVEREKERARKWKEEQDKLEKGGKEAEEADSSKSFLDTKGKRKVAFIKKEFHEDSNNCNAYMVFAHPHPDRASNVAPILDPYLAAEKVLTANGSSFMGRTIRVDRVRLPSSKALESATTALGKRDAWLPTGSDPKKSLFIGGLDYGAKEDDVRVFFEELVKGERGESEGGNWVKEVRLIRDKETQMGKGFGYVHFKDRESADEIIALPSTKLKFAKRPIRVQPCKTLPPTAKLQAPQSGPNGNSKPATTSKPVATKIIVPKGDPSLGIKLKSLSKEDRKLAKSTDQDRTARRLAKKKAKVAAMFEEKGAVKLGTGSKVEKKGRDEKIRKKKGRVRSENAVGKMKGSRT